MDTNALINLLFSGGTALAGLILVFLGGIFTAYDSYDAEQQSAVVKKYKLRAYLTFLGFISALATAAFAFAANWITQSFCLWVSTVSFALSFIFVIIVAIIAIRDIS